MKRREFLLRVGTGVFAAGLMPAAGTAQERAGADSMATSGPRSVIARARGTDLVAVTKAAVAKLGGIERFVTKGATVVIKPNVGWDRPFNYHANTHPDVVRAAAEMCLDAGASKISIVDFPVMGQHPGNAFEVSGMNALGTELGVRAGPAFEKAQFVDIALPDAAVLKNASVIRDLLESDVIINIPVAKSHGCTKYTGALKNWMGIVWNRRFFHQDFQTDSRTSPEHWNHIASCIAEIQQRIPPTLTIVDATTIMKTKGPQGPGELATPNEILAGTDQVALDAYAVSLFDTISLDEVLSIHRAAELGLGTMDVSQVEITDA